MDAFDLERIAVELGEGPVTFPEPGSPEFAQVPSGWQTIAEAPDPAGRCAAAMALWNRAFLDMVPTFAHALDERLDDVRVCRLRGDWTLLYIARADDGSPLVWIGWEPTSPGDTPPPCWDALPEPLREFLVDVHAGFTAPDVESYGVVPLSEMRTYAEWVGFDGPIPDWDEAGRIPSTRLMFVTSDGGLLRYCVSPDFSPGAIALVYEGDVDVKDDFGGELDQLMTSRFDTE